MAIGSGVLGLARIRWRDGSHHHCPPAVAPITPSLTTTRPWRRVARRCMACAPPTGGGCRRQTGTPAGAPCQASRRKRSASCTTHGHQTTRGGVSERRSAPHTLHSDSRLDAPNIASNSRGCYGASARPGALAWPRRRQLWQRAATARPAKPRSAPRNMAWRGGVLSRIGRL